LKLYTQHRNSAGERVRIALNLKGLSYHYISVPALPPGEYRRINPQGLLPALEVDGAVIAQSPAILDFLEQRWPVPALLPSDPVLRAQALAFGAHIASEMHAITVSRVRTFLGEELDLSEDGVSRWVAHWMNEGLSALEATLATRQQPWPFCYGDEPGWADLHLVPQLSNVRRFGGDLAPYPRLLAVEARCLVLDAFRLARPENQPDFPGA
jgi:maleylacetoacetate isomerase